MSAADLATPGQSTPRLDAASRRTRLRHYQEQLLERMQAARANTGASVSQLGVQIGEVRYLLDLTQAGEIVPVPPLTVVPLTRSWYLGLANIRGNLVGVIDLARFVAEGDEGNQANQGNQGEQGDQDDHGARAPAGAARADGARIVTFAGGIGFNCGLLASRVYGLRQAENMQPAGDKLRDADGNDWTALDLTILVADERFLQVGL